MTTTMLPGGVPVGRVIDRKYRVEGYLGGGQFGEVYEVWDLRQGQRVALKLLNPLRVPSGATWVEATLLTSLQGRFILPILNASDDGGVPYIVTDVMTNGTVEDKNPAGVGVPVNQAAEWIRQAAIGIARVHDRRLLHTDIKPGNLFLDQYNQVLVGDFGLASTMNAAGEGHAAGSGETMAPEVALGLPTTIRTDVYSLGASLYQLLAGHWLNPNLHTLTTRNAVLQEVAHHTPTNIGVVAPHVPIGLRQIVMKAVAPNPADRYASASELAAALGSRTIPSREWTRQVPCVGHHTCFIGTRSHATTIDVCVTPKGRRFVIEARHAVTGRRINPWPEITAAQLPTRLSSRLRDLA